jgi:uroporphyrin-III C-methyltransferase
VGTFATILAQIEVENFQAPAIVVIGAVVNYPANLRQQLAPILGGVN